MRKYEVVECGKIIAEISASNDPDAYGKFIGLIVCGIADKNCQLRKKERVEI